MNAVNPLSENDIAAIRDEVSNAAFALSAHEVPFLEGVRKLASLRFTVSSDHHDPDFMLFVGIASQADHIPNKEVRSLCSETWLAQCDDESKELELFYGQQVLSACAKLIARFTPAA